MSLDCRVQRNRPAAAGTAGGPDSPRPVVENGIDSSPGERIYRQGELRRYRHAIYCVDLSAFSRLHRMRWRQSRLSARRPNAARSPGRSSLDLRTMPVMKRRMFVYPWDIRDQGAGRVGERLVAARISSVAVATSYHPGKFLRPHAPRRRVWYPEDGAVYFRPDPALYGRLKPRWRRSLRTTHSCYVPGPRGVK